MQQGRAAMMVSARQLAVRCLVRWERERQSVQPLLDGMSDGASLSAQDRQLAVMMVLGVLRRLQELDLAIGAVSRTPLARMKPLTLMTLRVAVFQLLFLDRIPAAAAVNEAAALLRRERQPQWLVNFVNGVLRAIAREKTRFAGGAATSHEAVSNHPEWLVRRWQVAYGPAQALAICRANNREPLLTLRVNTLRTTAAQLTALLQAEGRAVRPGSYAPDSLVLEGQIGPVSSLPGFGEGLFHVQDEAAQLVALLLPPLAETSRCLDACAGLGGKTCHLAQILPPGAHLQAVEPSAHRVRLLAENLHRLRLAERVASYTGELAAFAATGPPPFARILVDAPCSGTGVIGRHPEIRWNRRPEELAIYQRQQLGLLSVASGLLTAGGVLVYATCSLEPEENREVIAAFLRQHPGFALTDCQPYLPAAASSLVDADGCLAPTPAQGLDGFFAARLFRVV